MLFEVIVEIIGSIIEVIIITLPTKKKKRIRKNISLLKEEPWFSELITNYSLEYRYKSSVRKILEKVDYEEIANDAQQVKKFKEALEQALKK